MPDVPPPGGYPPQPPGGYQPPPAAPQPPPYQPPQYQQPQQPQQPQYAPQPQQFQPVNPQAAKSGNGCLKAFLVFMAIATVLGIVGVVGIVVFANKFVDQVGQTFGVADAKDFEVTIDEGSCKIDELGAMSVSGTLTNKADRRQAYSLTVDFLDSSNTKLKSDSFITTGGLSKDAKAKWKATGFESGPTPPTEIKCKVSQVNYTVS